MATAAAKDFQMDMKEYFDRACNGEDVCVPGNGKENVFVCVPGNGKENVFIISEKVYHELQEARKTNEFLSGLVDSSENSRNREVLARSVEELRLV